MRLNTCAAVRLFFSGLHAMVAAEMVPAGVELLGKQHDAIGIGMWREFGYPIALPGLPRHRASRLIEGG